MSSFWNRFGPHAQLMRSAALSHPDLLRRLADAPDKTFHVYALWLDAHAEWSAAAAASALHGNSLAHLVAAAWATVPPGTLSALNRCGPAVHGRGFYEHLRAILTDARLSAALQRTKEPVTGRLLHRIGSMRDMLPELDEASRFISPEALSALDWLVRRLRRLGAAPHPDWQYNLLRNVTAKSYQKAVEALMHFHPRVVAPWPGNEQIVPLETPRALHEHGKAMRFCLGKLEYALELIRGTAAFYLWRAPVPAVIQIAVIAPGEWEISEMKSADNDEVGVDAFSAINAAFGAAGILPHRHTIALEEPYLA